MNKRLHSQKKADSSASNPVRSQFQSRPFIAQAKAKSDKPLTQTETENGEFQQQKFEATKLEIQAKNGTITPQGQEQLTVLQAKMSGTMQKRRQQASSNGRNFANIPISRPDVPSKLAVQTKLTIGKPGDEFEKDADQFAEELDKETHAPVSQQTFQNLQTQEMSVEEKEIQRKPMLQLGEAEGGMTATADLETAIKQAKVGGKQLPEKVRKPIEEKTGKDYSVARVHDDEKADLLCKELNARAFTTRNHMFFGKNEYNTASQEGRFLINHEAKHMEHQNAVEVQRSSLTPQQFLQQPATKISTASVCPHVVQAMEIGPPIPGELEYESSSMATICALNVIDADLPDMKFTSGGSLHAEEKAIAKLEEYVQNGKLVPQNRPNDKDYTVMLSVSKSPCSSTTNPPTRTDDKRGCTELIEALKKDGITANGSTVTFNVNIVATKPYQPKVKGGKAASNEAYESLSEGSGSGTFPYVR